MQTHAPEPEYPPLPSPLSYARPIRAVPTKTQQQQIADFIRATTQCSKADADAAAQAAFAVLVPKE